MSETRPLPDPVEDGFKFPRWLTALIAVAVVVCIVLAFLIPPSAPEPSPGNQLSAADRELQAVSDIESAMEAYANAHGGRFPTGNSSTEVFQKLLDEHFIKDPRFFYLEMNGKAVATSSVLTPSNVAFDVTVPVDITTSGFIPVVFSTGYRIEYKPGGQAVPLPGHPQPDGILIAYPGHHAFYRTGDKTAGGAVKEVIPSKAEMGTDPYAQLTPDGPLPTP